MVQTRQRLAAANCDWVEPATLWDVDRPDDLLRLVLVALKVALVVGTVLNIINQGGRVMEGLPPSWFHVVLNYLVPYCVSSYSAARNEMRRGEGDR